MQVHLARLQLYQAADKRKRGQPPKPIPTPWDAKEARQFTPSELSRKLLEQRERVRKRQDGN